MADARRRVGGSCCHRVLQVRRAAGAGPARLGSRFLARGLFGGCERVRNRPSARLGLSIELLCRARTAEMCRHPASNRGSRGGSAPDPVARGNCKKNRAYSLRIYTYHSDPPMDTRAEAVMILSRLPVTLLVLCAIPLLGAGMKPPSIDLNTPEGRLLQKVQSEGDLSRRLMLLELVPEVFPSTPSAEYAWNELQIRYH